MKPILLILLALTVISCSRTNEASKVTDASKTAAAAKPQPIAVRTALAETKSVERSIDVTGSLTPDETVSVSSEVPGRVVSVNFDFGQTVKKGAVVAQLDRQEFQIQLDRANAALAQALARVGLNPDQADTPASNTPSIRSARAQLEDARSKYENAKKLSESGDIARERLTELEKLVNARTAALDAAQDELRTLMASIQAIKADKRLIEKRLADTAVYAPFDGQVSQRMVSPGQYIKDNTPILTIVKSWPLRLRLDVPEVATAAVRVGDTLRFTTEAIPGQTFTATVTQMNPSLDARSRSLNAEARLNQSNPALRPGMFVQVRLTVSKNFAITVVPKESVYTVAGLTKLFTISGGKAKEIRFSPGQAGDTWLEVPGGLLQPGETVAVEKLQLLTDGAEVQPRS